MQKEEIINLFYTEHLKVKDIAKIAGTSSTYITKIIKQDERYSSEKDYRKTLGKNNKKLRQNKFIKNKRDNKRINDNYEFVKQQHSQASRELSKAKHMSNETFRKWNSSAYLYNPSKKRYEFDPKLIRASDVPKYIKVKGN